MAIDNFKFSSPGVFINEIDDSTLPAQPELAGPVIVGKARKGPAMIPTRVRSYNEFVEIFGEPIYGQENTEDVWKEGNLITPSYGAIAALTSLRNGVPVTFVRTLGIHGSTDGTVNASGWHLGGASIGTSSNAHVSASSAAYALIVMPYSGSYAVNTTGSVAAIIYANGRGLALSGSYVTGSSAEKASALIKGETGTSSNSEFTLVVSGSSSSENEKITFSLDKSKANFIRRKLNTNPTTDAYFLGESFEDLITTNTSLGSSSWAAALVPMESGSYKAHNHRLSSAASSTEYVFAKWTGTPATFNIDNVTNLFKFHSLTAGEWNHKNLKICIENIRESSNTSYKYGKFDVVIRELFTDKVFESYTGVSLDPDSENYIAKAIGDTSYSWDDDRQTLVASGDYASKSKYVRVEVTEAVKNKDIDPTLLPFGFKLVGKYADVQVTVNTVGTTYLSQSNNAYVLRDSATGIAGLSGSSGYVTASIVFPSLPTVTSGKKGTVWGLKDVVTGSSKTPVTSLTELLSKYPYDHVTASTEYFSLDNLSGTLTESSTLLTYSTAAHSSTANPSYVNLTTFLKYHNSFAMPLAGGFDGLDILEKQPISDDNIGDVTDEDSSYVLKTVNRALNLVSDRETVPCNAVLVPGISKPVVTNKIIDVCSTRADAIALIDLQNIYVPANETSSNTASSVTVDTAISQLKSRDINNSYAACFYPWVKIKNPKSASVVYIPATVAALAAITKSEKLAGNVWFAPAGFTRGKLDNDPSIGINVSGVTTRLTQRERDKLYEANINPIASLPEGIILFGQKTLQVTPSALDRINVRRLMNYVKTEISKMASTTLFEPNVSLTWKNFTDRADPFLTSIVAGQGLAEYKLVLDETTTTPDLIDRNIIYGKVFLKPVRAAEFFALDFTIVRSNANLTE
jgi:hypothetical protein